jgi:hypothetical protein
MAGRVLFHQRFNPQILQIVTIPRHGEMVVTLIGGVYTVVEVVVGEVGQVVL